MVYVLNCEGIPITPTERHGKVRRLLRDGKAKVVKRTPFTIQLLYETTNYTPEMVLGDDTGYAFNGISVSSEQKEYYSAEVQLRTDIPNLMSTRREARRTRRGRKTRYRKPKSLNRVKSKQKGWLPPSVEQRIDSHVHVIENVMKILPIHRIRVEVAQFDTQKMRADMEELDRPEGTDYQQGPQLGFWNVREYVLYRDGHTCQCCHGKSGDKILNVHHIESRKTGGNAPNNLVTLCETCHNAYHHGKIQLPPDIKRQESLRDSAAMNMMRWKLGERIKDKFAPMGIDVAFTYGYITKDTRIRAGLPKEHRIDALCIAGHPHAKPAKEYFVQRKIRCHNRKVMKDKILKKGVRKRNQSPRVLFGYRLFDKVKYRGQETFIFGRRSSGSFDIRKLDGTKISASVNYKKLSFLEPANHYITERRSVSSAHMNAVVSDAD